MAFCRKLPSSLCLSRIKRQHSVPVKGMSPVMLFLVVLLLLCCCWIADGSMQRGGCVALASGRKCDGSSKTKKVSCVTSRSCRGSPLTLLQDFGSEFLKTIKDSRDHLVAGAAARGISIFLLYPLDTVKTRLQMSPTTRAQLPPLEVKNLFRGVLGSLTGQIPYGMLTFGSYEVYKSKLLAAFPDAKPDTHTHLYVLAAIAGDLTGSFWLCPSEVLKQQMQGGMHASLPKAVQTIYANSGINGFYRGYAGQIMRDVPFRAVQLPSYEIVKQAWTRRFATDKKTGETRSLRNLETMCIGAIAGSFSAAITTPLDVLKTRLMTDRGAVVTFGGAAKAAKEIARTEGLKGLFSGLGPRVVYVGPSVGVFFVVYESVKRALVENSNAELQRKKK